MPELSPEQVKQLLEENEALKKSNSLLQEELNAQKEECINLKAELAKNAAAAKSAASAKKAAVAPKSTVEVDGKTYVWAVRSFRKSNGEVVTSEEASTDMELVKELLKIEGQGLLREQL